MKARGGIDLGGTKIQAVVVDGNDKVRGEAREPTPTDGGPPDVIEAMATAMRDAAADAKAKPEALQGIGVGSPGSVDAKTGIVSQANNLPGWEGSYPMAKELEKELGAPVKIAGDVQVGTDAEFRLGAGRGRDSMLGVFWGTGVGGGVVLGGKLWKGRGEAGEIGHMVVKRGGAKCPCGRRGCMEAYAGRKAMEAEARKRHKKGEKTDLFKIMEKRDRDRLTSGVWARAADAGDELTLELLDRAVEALGAGLASAVNLLDPELIVIGGGMGTRFGQPYVERIAAAMKPHLFLDSKPPDMKLVALGDFGGGIGAAMLVK